TSCLRSREVRGQPEFAVLGDEAWQIGEVASGGARKGPANALHILLRHRLLRQPGSFEGDVYVRIDSYSHNPMVASEVRDQRIRHVELDTAGTSSCADAADDDHRVADLAHVVVATLP